MHPKALIPRLKLSELYRPLIDGMEGEVLLDYVYKTLREREGFYHKAHKVGAGYNLSVKKLQLFCLED